MKKTPIIQCTIAASLLAIGLNSATATDLYQEMGITKPEQEAIMSAINSAREISKRAEQYNGLPYRRDAHAKATGCARATFSINPDIPERFKAGMFADADKQYQAWIRFSNGDMLVQADSKGDARGMAVKVMGVPGKAIAPELGESHNQDFIMTNTPAFFNRNIFDYADDMLYLAKFERTKWFISFFPPRLHPKQFYRAIQTVSSVIDTPLNAQYFSMLPYQLGKSTIKFSTKPCSGMSFPNKVDKSNPDYLSKQLETQLANGGACFEFMLQEKVPGHYMPVDDATAIWSEKASPFITVATINIPPQYLYSDQQQQFCENISMNPWRAVEGWEPLSSLNKARRVVYQAVSKYRHSQNKVPTPEPSSWCISENGEACDENQGLIVSKPSWPLPRCFDQNAKSIDGETLASDCKQQAY
ncbi:MULTISPECIES: catalase [unclassified Agarivorans]|uniref:catalase n=1 Tax=unclassified Agarivorans TaxID=2636026 RepID=UPI0026E13261|nr:MULTISPECIES: catalase [unclassified Agarivorans]MDO6686077.1 catalase [Agarivorans sp. 3_MG-2023]MDO6713785.1 catalase [Agarivorans sp. 2_MG-2023]